jgi:perosamine synthetase
MLADYVGSDFSVATSSGTAALHIALLVAGVEPNDEVLVSTLSFIAPANAIRYVGAWPVFMDADPLYWQMDPEKVRSFLRDECRWQSGGLVNKSTGRRVKAILPVHILGNPCDMGPLLHEAREFGLRVIEDATESLGAAYNGRMVGHIGDIGCFSFNGNKLITTGGGGMIVTDNGKWAQRAQYLTTQAKNDPIEYIHDEIGYNYRLTNIQAAMGVAQMERIQEFVELKNAIASGYDRALGEMAGITLMQAHSNANPVFWLYTVLLQQQTSLEQRQSVLRKLDEAGIGARPLWHTLHDLPPYIDCQAFRIEHAVGIYHRSVSLPSSVGLTEDEQQRCIAIFRDIVNAQQ